MTFPATKPLPSELRINLGRAIVTAIDRIGYRGAIDLSRIDGEAIAREILDYWLPMNVTQVLEYVDAGEP